MKPLKTLIATTVAIGASSLWAANSAAQTKEFHIFLPNNTAWQSSTPLINENGKDHALEIDPEHCGWYIRRYINEPIPQKVLIHRDDDTAMAEAIGMNGAWESNSSDPEAIQLDGLFDLAGSTNALYFVADEDQAATLPAVNKGWFLERPQIEGTCEFWLATLVYDTDASLHGAFSCEPNWNPGQTESQARANACFYPDAKFPVVSSNSDEFPCIGLTTGIVESTLSTNEKGAKKPKLTAKGKACFGAQADEAFAAMFESTPGVNETYCVDMPFVKAADGKYEFNSDTYMSPGATVPGGFYPAETAPAAELMISERLPAAESKRKAEGPTFFCTDEASSATPLGLRTIHPTEGVPVSDLICNGPGWDGGSDCEGLFAAGSEFISGAEATPAGALISKKFGVSWIGDGWAWSCPTTSAPEGWQFYQQNTEKPITSNNEGSYRWTSTDGSNEDDSRILTTGGRNQHFCTESHSTFRYKKGLKFSFSSAGDLWVYLDNKLAVDLGGSHLPTPAYVDLDKFLPDAEVGSYYDIDIYSCDRRTTTSSLRIKTNMFVEKATGITYTGKQDKNAYITKNDNQFKLCYIESSAGSCAAALGNSTRTSCETDIMQPIKFTFTKDPTAADPSQTIISPDEFETTPIQANGGINVTIPGKPIINTDKLKESLPGGTYYLVIQIGSDKTAIKVVISCAETAAGITINSKTNKEDYIKNANNHYEVCYHEQTNTCSVNENIEEKFSCGGAISQPITYTLTTDPTATDPSQTIVSPEEFAATPILANGGIDVSNPGKPIINTETLKGYLPGGVYYLVVTIGQNSKAIKITITSNVGIANREAVVVSNDGTKSLPYEFSSMALASTSSIDGSVSASQLVPLYIASIVDPCNSTTICNDPLEMHSAAGATYSLKSSSNKVIFYAKKNGKFTEIDPSASRTIGASGIDTVYATIPADELSAEAEKVSINVKGSSRIAEITFFAPKLVFVKSEASLEVVNSDPDSRLRLQGASYEIYLIAIRPDHTICTECNFSISKGIQTSAGINVIAGGRITNGRGVVGILATRTYEKGTESGTATLHIVGPQQSLTSSKYTNMQFVEGTLASPETKVLAKSDFSITKVNPLEFVISTNNLQQGAAKKFAVMDMKGQIITTGNLTSDTHVKVPTSGSYVVKVGQGYKRVNMK